MKDCKECGKKLSVFEGYTHPTMGKKYLLCSPCYDQVSESVEKWKEFVLSNSFKMRASKGNSQLDWKKIIPGLIQKRNTYDEVWTG